MKLIAHFIGGPKCGEHRAYNTDEAPFQLHFDHLSSNELTALQAEDIMAKTVSHRYELKEISEPPICESDIHADYTYIGAF